MIGPASADGEPGELQGEGRALGAAGAMVCDPAVVCVHYRLAHGQADAWTVYRLAGLPGVGADGVGQSRTAVADANASDRAVDRHLEVERAAVGHGVERVDGQVQDGVLQLRR